MRGEGRRGGEGGVDLDLGLAVQEQPNRPHSHGPDTNRPDPWLLLDFTHKTFYAQIQAAATSLDIDLSFCK